MIGLIMLRMAAVLQLVSCYAARVSPVFINPNITALKLARFRDRIQLQKQQLSHLPTIYELPEINKDTHDESYSFLVSYCLAGNALPRAEKTKLSKTKDIMINQLLTYREASEHDLNIHVVITTLINDWSKYPEIFMPNTSDNYIFRTQSMLPIAFVLSNFAYPRNPGAVLKIHRYIFLELVSKYDFFLVQEDDCLVKLRNLHYFIKYFKLLGEGKGVFIPTFLDYELPSNYVTVDQGMKRIDPAIFFLGLSNDMHLVLENGVLYWNTNRPIHRFTIYSQWMVEKFSKLESWFGDEALYFVEPNVHYGWMGMHRFYRAVIPVKNLLGAFTHHTANRYINDAVAKDIKDFTLPKLNELKAYFNHIFEIAAQSNPFFAKQHFRRYNTNYNLTVTVSSARNFKDMESCLNSGGYYQIGYEPESNHYEHASESSSIRMVNYGNCVSEENVLRQDLVACNKFEIFYYGNRTSGEQYQSEDVKVPFDHSLCNPPEYSFPLVRNRKFIS